MNGLRQHRFSVRVFFIVLVLFVFSGVGVAAEFSADFLVRTKGEEDISGKIFVKGKMIRQEMSEEGETQIMIVRPDKSVTWMLTPEEKMYMEIPYQSSEGESFEEWSLEKEKNAKLLGEETISGYPTKKYELVEDGEKSYFWVSKKLSFPIKVEDTESVMEYKNIKEGNVADVLFEVPAGYEKMSFPAAPLDKSEPQE